MAKLLTTTIIIAIMNWCLPCQIVEAYIGVNWGRQTSHRLIPSTVVDLLLQNDIHHLQIFNPSDHVLWALTGGEIAVTVMLPNIGLARLSSVEEATSYLQQRIIKHVKSNVNISSLHVGGEPFSTTLKNNYTNAVEALEFVREALDARGYGNITLTTPHYTDMFKAGIKRPSEAEFRDDIKDKMLKFVHFLNRTGAPFVITMYPIDFMNDYGFDLEFCFVDNRSNFSIKDGDLTYRNVFEFVYDAVVTVLRKAGVPDLKIVVGQIGWPTDGYPGANAHNAERFFKGFLPYIRSNKGSPLRPNISIDILIQSLADENRNKVSRGTYQRHLGIYRTNGEPKYKIDFTGQDRDIYPTTAKGITHMPRRWCVFNGDTRNLTKVNEQFDIACSNSDCSSLAPGGSCGRLDYVRNVSYAFNSYFQATDMRESDSTCEFSGLGKVVTDNPSVGTCVFPIEILTAEREDSVVEVTHSGGDSRLRAVFGSAGALFLTMLLIVCL